MTPAGTGNSDERSCGNSGPPIANRKTMWGGLKYTCIYIFIRLILVRSMRTSFLLATLASVLMIPFAAAKEPKASDGTRDGSSVEKAVLVRGGIKAERAWMLQHFHYAPRINYEHATIVREGRIFSYYSFSTPEGKRREVYFDTGDYVRRVKVPEMDPTR